MEVSIESSGKDLVALEWEMVVPARVLDLAGDGPETGRASADSGKAVRCSKQKDYLYGCTIAGDPKPIMNGPIAVYRFKVHPDVQSSTAVLRIEKIEARTSDGRQYTLHGAEGTIAIH